MKLAHGGAARKHAQAACRPRHTHSRASARRCTPACPSRSSRAESTPVEGRASANAPARRPARLAATQRTLLTVALLSAAAAAPGVAWAEEGLPPGLVDQFEGWLASVGSLGALGPAAFIATVSVVECIPFFPTQPLTIGAGLLFGATGGAACNLAGLCTASTIAFYASRTVGQDLAAKVIKAETEGEPGPVQKQLSELQHTIENGSVLQQFVAILLLRLTPVVPFSASNYVLGLSPVTYPPFICATLLGMTVWSTVFSSLGAAARNLVTSGMDFDAALAVVTEDAGEATEKGLAVAVLAGVVVFAFQKFVPSPVPSPLPDAEDVIRANEADKARQEASVRAGEE